MSHRIVYSAHHVWETQMNGKPQPQPADAQERPVDAALQYSESVIDDAPSRNAAMGLSEAAIEYWESVIDDGTASTEILAALAAEMTVLANRCAKVRERLARRADTPPDAHRFLMHDQSQEVQAAVARNPGAPADTLNALACSPDAAVAVAVAGNPSSPPSALTSLAEFDGMHDVDIEDEIRFIVASNPGSDAGTLGAVLGFGDSEVNYSLLGALVTHRNISEVDLRYITTLDPDGEHGLAATRRLGESPIAL